MPDASVDHQSRVTVPEYLSSPALRELIQHGETGMPVRFRDVDRLSAELRAVLEDPIRGDGLGRRARSTIALRCSIPVSLDDRRRFFAECLEA